MVKLKDLLNEGGMELKKLEDAIKMFQKKIKKQGRVTNARDEEHLERLMKVYNDMGGRKIKENSESLNWLQEKCWKGYEKKGMKTMFGKRYPNCVKKKKSESVNEFKTIYNKNKAAMKIRSLQRDKNAKVYKVDKKRTKYQGKDLIVYNLLTKNKNHSTNQNPYGLDMMKGAYLIPVEESINEAPVFKYQGPVHKNTREAMKWARTQNFKKDYGVVKVKGGHKVIVQESINEQQYFDPNSGNKTYMDYVLKKAGIRVITFDPMKKSFYNGIWGGFYTVASSNKVDMPGQGKVRRSSAVLPVYIDKKNQIELGVSGDGFKLGKAGSSQVLKNLKDFKKSDLEESINERAWTPAQEKAVKELDKKFYKLIGKKGIEPYTYEASQMWTSGGFRKEMRKIFGKDVKESVNENISDSQKFKIYNSLKKGDIVSIKYDSSIAKGSKFHPFLVTKGKTKLMKGKVERIIMIPADTKNKKFKRYLYNRNGRISLALGDMGAVIVDMKKGEVNEGTCGYGEDGKLGEEPAGPHLLKKKKKKDVNEARLDPKQLLQQLGGNKFIAMTGAKNLAVDKAKNTLHMKIGRNSKGVSHLRIKLTGADLYDMEFLQVRAGNVKVKAKETGLYADQLQKMFTKHTGMYTSL